ncbi:Delta(3-5)-Delta(2-4)-dienoyl-CoA isomerase [Penicillium chermesinum]|uniref:Delta(3-5)-Delta(2-4)-dienoyl-CoA isomerase n=1 Tax=Penicillium chermesinum TaxID=63820 RepID=A0A9W9TGA0_9EURO|nr:Delta(3-5)-Delta(2-4)-dienoyl-CoA isomerase [Penicillium chermesinum]KAJ5220385.1 Delta(3-5)-Delta(2-4)-dienoyl-CoA isomerase [Penicillium chermesinum]
MAQGYSFKYFNVDFPSSSPYVAHVEINRADKLNSFFEDMWLELRQVFDKLSTDPSVRAIVLTGAGDKAFTAGLDVKAASQGTLFEGGASDPARKAWGMRHHIVEFQDCITAIERCEKPVIAALHGFSFGLAIDISSAADIRVCARDVKFAVKEGNYGWVKEVALTARTFGAEEALRVGLVNAVYENKARAVEEAFKLAALIASKSPVAVQGTKEILNYSRDHTVSEGLRYTAVWNSAALQTTDVNSALLSGIQKRTPTFEKL